MHKNRTTADCVGSYVCRLNPVDHPSKLMCSGMPKQTTLKRMTIELVARSVASSRAKDRYRSFMCQSGRKQTKPISFLYLQTNILRRGDTQRHATDEPEFLALKHESRIFGHSSNPLCGFSMMEQATLCAVWPMENLLGSSLNQIQYRVGLLSENPTLMPQSKDLCMRDHLIFHDGGARTSRRWKGFQAEGSGSTFVRPASCSTSNFKPSHVAVMHFLPYQTETNQASEIWAAKLFP